MSVMINSKQITATRYMQAASTQLFIRRKLINEHFNNE